MRVRHGVLSAVLAFAVPALAGAQVLFNGVDVGQQLTRDNWDWHKGEWAEAGEVLILFPKGGRSADARASLTEAGYDVLAALPPDAYLVRVRDVATVREKALSGPVELVMPLKPEWKIAAEFAAVDPASPETVGVALLMNDAPTADLEKALVVAGAVLSNTAARDRGRLGLRVPAGRLRDVLAVASADPQVITVQPAFGARLLNDGAAVVIQSGTTIGGTPIWDRGLRGQGQVIAILDTGLDYLSCYFREADNSVPPLVQGTGIGVPDPSRRKIIAYNFLFEDDYPGEAADFDNQNHGTYVAGNALGSMINNPIGFGVDNGMAPLAQVVVQDGGFTTTDNCSDLAGLGCPVIDLTAIFDQAIGQGAHIHNNSWGDRENFHPQNTYTGPTADADDAIWRQPEFLIVCAAGNSAINGINSVGSPSVAKNVLSIGAARGPGFGQDPEQITTFSSLGYAADGRIKPDLTAPGQTVTAARFPFPGVESCQTASIQGTSMASPVTAGGAALLRQYFTEGFHPSGAPNPADAFVPTAALLKAVLINGAVDMTGVPGPPPNRTEGWGRIHLENSLYFPGDTRRIVLVDRRSHFSSGADGPFRIAVEAGGNGAAGPLKVTLVWTDPPAAPLAAVALVNDLDLTVEQGAGRWLGNVFDGATGFSTAGGEPDRRNTVEQVVLPGDRSGTFLVTVTPALIDVPGQGFALVVGGDAALLPPPDMSGWVIR